MANLTGAAAGSTGLEGNILVDENLWPGLGGGAGF